MRFYVSPKMKLYVYGIVNAFPGIHYFQNTIFGKHDSKLKSNTTRTYNFRLLLRIPDEIAVAFIF